MEFQHGDYLILVDSDLESEEMYRFSLDGTSLWFYGSDAKFGVWKLENDIIEITTKGYTDDIIEKYHLVDNEWENVDHPIRKLKKIK